MVDAGLPDVDPVLPVELVASELSSTDVDPVNELTVGAGESEIDVEAAPLPLVEADVASDEPSAPVASDADWESEFVLGGAAVVDTDPALVLESIPPELSDKEDFELDPASEAEESMLGAVVTGVSDADPALVLGSVTPELPDEEASELELAEAEPEIDSVAGARVLDPVPDVAPDSVDAES